MKYVQLANSIKTNVYPALVICGNDAFLRNNALAQIKESLHLDNPTMNMMVYQETSNLEEIINDCNTLPFFDNFRLVIAQDCFFDSKKNTSTASKEDIAFLQKYLDNPNQSTCLVFVNNYNISADIYKVNGLEQVICDKLDIQLLIDWIIKTITSHNITIDSSEARLIVQYCNGDMSKINNEVNKLINYCDDVITRQDIDKIVVKDIEYGIFDLCNLISKKDVKGSLGAASQLFDNEDSAVKIIITLYKTYRRMFFATNSEFDDTKLSKLLGVSAYAISISRNQAKSYTALQLKKALDIIADADKRIKSNFIKDIDMLNQLVLQLLNIGGKTA